MVRPRIWWMSLVRQQVPSHRLTSQRFPLVWNIKTVHLALSSCLLWHVQSEQEIICCVKSTTTLALIKCFIPILSGHVFHINRWAVGISFLKFFNSVTNSDFMFWLPPTVFPLVKVSHCKSTWKIPQKNHFFHFNSSLLGHGRICQLLFLTCSLLWLKKETVKVCELKSWIRILADMWTHTTWWHACYRWPPFQF